MQIQGILIFIIGYIAVCQTQPNELVLFACRFFERMFYDCPKYSVIDKISSDDLPSIISTTVGKTDNPITSKTTDNPTTDGATDNPTTVVSDGTTDTSTTDGTTDTSTTVVTTDNPTSVGKTDNPTTDGTTDNPTTVGAMDNSTTVGTTANPTTDGTTDTSTTVVTTDNPTTVGTTDNPTTDGTTDIQTTDGTTNIQTTTSEKCTFERKYLGMAKTYNEILIENGTNSTECERKCNLNDKCGAGFIDEDNRCIHAALPVIAVKLHLSDRDCIELCAANPKCFAAFVRRKTMLLQLCYIFDSIQTEVENPGSAFHVEKLNYPCSGY